MKLIIVFILGSGILLVSKIVRILMRKENFSTPIWRWILKYFPVLELLLWLAWFFWSVRFLFRDEFFFPYLLIGSVMIILSLFAWYFVKELFAGMVFKVQNDIRISDNINAGGISGQVKSIKLTHIEVLSDNGNKVKIPYSRLSSEMVTGIETSEGSDDITLHFLADKRKTKSEITALIKNGILNSPWCNYKFPPYIKLETEDKSTYTFKVQIKAVNQNRIGIIENAIQKKLNE